MGITSNCRGMTFGIRCARGTLKISTRTRRRLSNFSIAAIKLGTDRPSTKRSPIHSEESPGLTWQCFMEGKRSRRLCITLGPVAVPHPYSGGSRVSARSTGPAGWLPAACGGRGVNRDQVLVMTRTSVGVTLRTPGAASRRAERAEPRCASFVRYHPRARSAACSDRPHTTVPPGTPETDVHGRADFRPRLWRKTGRQQLRVALGHRIPFSPGRLHPPTSAPARPAARRHPGPD